MPTSRIAQITALLCLAMLAGTAQATPVFQVTFEAPGVTGTTATFDYVGVETFDNRATGTNQSFTTDFGTTPDPTVITASYSDVQIRQADQWGGFEDSNYAVALQQGASYSLNISATNTGDSVPVTYFGYWLSALNEGNTVTFYRDGTEIFSYDTGDILAKLGSCPGSLYCGNPDAQYDGGPSDDENYVFVNFFDLTGDGFDKIVFEQMAGGGYESDNHTVGSYKTISGTLVDVPAPSTLALFALTLIGLGVATRRKQRGN